MSDKNAHLTKEQVDSLLSVELRFPDHTTFTRADYERAKALGILALVHEWENTEREGCPLRNRGYVHELRRIMYRSNGERARVWCSILQWPLVLTGSE
jgi:hypothetical protein